MPPVVITGTLSIRVIWALGGSDWAVNAPHALIGASPAVDQSMADTIASALGSAHSSSGLNALQPTSVELSRVQIRDIRTANNAPVESSIASAGTATGELLPRGTGLVVTQRTARAGTSFRGRMYTPGFSEASNTATGRADQAAQDAATAFWSDFANAMQGQGWPLAVASRKLGQSTVITNSLVRDAVWDGQRRRAFNGI